MSTYFTCRVCGAMSDGDEPVRCRNKPCPLKRQVKAYRSDSFRANVKMYVLAGVIVWLIICAIGIGAAWLKAN